MPRSGLRQVGKRDRGVAHERARGGLVLQAHGRHGDGLVEVPLRELPAEERVGELAVPLAVPEHGPCPGDEQLLGGGPGGVDGTAAGDELEQEDAEAVDVGLDGEGAGAHVLGGAVAVGAHDARGAVADGAELGEAEVGELGAEGVVEEDVGGLEVAVDHGRVGRLVQVLEAPGGAQRDAHARLPAQLLQVAGEGAQSHVLVDEQALLAVGAVAYQIHQIRVVQLAEHEHLHHELVVALRAVPVKLLHGHHLPAALQPAPVHAPEPALAQQALRSEVARRRRQLPVADGCARTRLTVAGYDCRASSSTTTTAMAPPPPPPHPLA